MPTLTAQPATDKQTGYLTSLTNSRDYTDAPENILDTITEHVDGQPVDKAAASAAITWLLQAPAATTIFTTDAAPAAPAPAPVTEDGMYRDPADGTIYKIQKAVHGSGNLYAKRLVIDRAWERDEAGNVLVEGAAHFEYAPGAINTLTAEMRMTLDEAKAFGALYGTCCKCGATLTKEKSIAAGIGPVCGARGW